MISKQQQKQQKKRPTSQNKRAPIPRQRNQGGTGNTITLTNCGTEYFVALHDPFQVTKAPCIPSQLPLPSHKFAVVTRGDFKTYSSGNGGIAVWPMRMLFRDYVYNGANLLPAVVTSIASQAYTDYQFTNQVWYPPATPEVVYFAGTSSPFTAAQFDFSTGRSAKVVASGVRISTMGKPLDATGSYITFTMPSSRSYIDTTQDTVANFLAYNQATRIPITKETVALATYRPAIDVELSSMPYPGVWQAGTLLNRLGYCIFIQGGDVNATYQFEVITHFEVFGEALSLTPSHSDPHAVPVAIAGSAPAGSGHLASALGSAVKRAVEAAASNGVRLVMPGLTNVAKGVATLALPAIAESLRLAASRPQARLMN